MLEIHELLDRFELLYPTNSKIPDLRRVYIDKDLSSLFRLVDVKYIAGETDDFRKAIIEQNLHSIFRIINDTDLRKLVLENNIWKLWPVLNRYIDTQFILAFKNFLVNNTVIDKDCFSQGQLQSKLWLINELKKLDLNLGTVFLCAGWYATLGVMLFESEIKVDKIRSFDIDPLTVEIAETFNKPWFVNQWQFKALIEDIHNVNYNEHTWQFWSNTNNRMSYPITDKPDTIINTSTEHIENFAKWYEKIPDNKLVVLQGNDYFEISEHLNCSHNLNEFSLKFPMQTVLYEGELELPKYKRFMKIGFK